MARDVLTALSALSILTSVLVLYRMNQIRNYDFYYGRSELFDAAVMIRAWILDGRCGRIDDVYRHLIHLVDVDNDLEAGLHRLELISGPNGWTIYQMLQARRRPKSWFRWLFTDQTRPR